ncbi:SdrD B-like domain-containing protein, partial [Arthrospira platensis SPKY1]|nr:SdrD B-like domain-containing protein [Arthrospira platensis SPKY1]
ANGYYYFDNLNAGDYFVHIPASNFGAGQPLENKESYPGADVTDNTDGNDNGIDDANAATNGISSNTFTLTPNAEPTDEDQTDYPGALDDDNVNGTIDFTFRTEKVAVGNYVFMDTNDDGVFNGGDMAIAGVAVDLYAAGAVVGTDAPLFSTTTNANGYYYFDNLNAGDYFVHIPASNFGAGQPLENKESYPGADVTDNTDGNDNGIDDANAVTNGISSNTFTLTPNAEPTDEDQTDYPGALDDDNVNGTIDFTFRTETVAVGDYVWVDLNNNGLQDGGEPGVQGITVRLYDAATETEITTDVFGNPLNPEVTDVNGQYLFEGLPEGDYYVIFDLTTVPDY